jgi:hypothetical protein
MLDYTNRELEEQIDQLQKQINKVDDQQKEHYYELRAETSELHGEIERLTQKTAEPIRERSAFVPGLGVLRVRGTRCVCGRELQPYDFKVGARGTWQAICANCHTAVIETDLPEA